MNKIDKFLKGKYPECKKNPKGIHVRIAGMGVKPHCLWCKIKM